MAFKTCCPCDNEIAIIHLSQYMPVKKINLGNWSFVCFVRHTPDVEKQVYGYETENNCEIMMLLRRGNRVRLLSIKACPWTPYGQENDLERDEYALSLFKFSGMIENIHQLRGDKIENCQLISERINSQDSYLFIV